MLATLLLLVNAIAMGYSEGTTKRCNLDGMSYVLDVDTGVDDAMALMEMLSYNKCVEAITVVAGNTNLENAYNNTMRVLQEIKQERRDRLLRKDDENQLPRVRLRVTVRNGTTF
uniref:Putative purine hydrolase aedes aegypti salivary purine nucleosidase n=1 Tax=Ixodes ricinus TaxID=34613 RepID=A0A0K8R547_IXORI